MSTINVKKRNGRLEPVDVNKINKVIARACEGLSDVSASEIAIDAKLQFFDKIPTVEIDKALILTASSKIEKEPNYSYVASRLQLNCLYKEVFGEGIDADTFELLYRKSFIANIKKLVKEQRFDSRLLSFDLKKLAASLVLNRDDLFKFVGIKNLYHRYFTTLNGRRMETPQGFWMRVAMGLALNEEDPTAKAIEFYEMLSTFRMCSSTPTLFNSGTTHPQLSSCYLNTFEDSIDGIFDGLWQEARKSKYAGGLGFDVTPFRATGAHIKGTNGSSSGLIPWLKLYNDLLIGVNQGGRRNGAGCAYLEPWHLDVEEFIELRRTTGDHRRRTHDMNIALWIPDLFMEYVEQDRDWYLFCPSETGDLHELFGKAFNARYAEYVAKAEAGELKQFKVINAKDFWKKVLKAIYETSHPWLVFKDASNIRYSNQHEGVVHSSNLCTEIMLHTKPSKYKDGVKTEVGETAVCNLASINMATHVSENGVNYEMLAETVKSSIRMLDSVVDINFYPTEEARNSNLKHRPIGLGSMGFHDACHILDIIIDSDEAVELAGRLQEFIAYYAIQASAELAKEKGRYQTYEGSTWSKGKLPIDTYKELMEFRGVKDAFYDTYCPDLDYTKLRALIAENGMRNSNTMAIAPTATISYIQGCEQSIEPNFSVLFVYENSSGNTYILNEHFVRDMKKIGVWSPQFVAELKAVDGDVLKLDIPEKYQQKYKTAFDRDVLKLIDVAAARQSRMDMGQSLNLYIRSKSMRALHEIAMHAWKRGLKSTYYWRNKASTDIEKSTSEVVIKAEPKAEVQQPICSLEARMRGEICESCS